MPIAIIAAMDRNRLIGDGHGLPWRLPADLRRFRALTMGKPVIMGRRTHESIGKALPGRTNIVLSRSSAGYQTPDCVVVASLQEALDVCADAPEPMIIGGAQLYAEALARAQRMYLTLLDARFSGDAWFPEYDRSQWRETCREDHAGDENSPCAFSFVDLERA